MGNYADKYTSYRSLVLEDDILKVYQQAQREILEKTDSFVKRHTAKDAEMQKKLKNGEITEQQYKQWLIGQVFISQQWKQKQESIEKVLLNADKEAAKLVRGASIDVFAENGNYTAYEIEKDFAGAVNFGLYDRNTVSRYLRDNPKTLPEWKIDEKKDYIWNQKNVQNAILQGIIQGEGIPEISKRMAKELSSKNANKMTLFSRTAMTGAQNSGRIERMHEAEEQGIKVKKQWLATLDDRTRDTHQKLDGQIRDVNEPFEVDGMDIDYPGDPNAEPELVYNCRCALRYVYPGIKQNRERRAYRINEETGKRESYIVGDVTYQEWKEGKIESDKVESDIVETQTEQQEEKTRIEQVKDIIVNHEGDWSLDELQNVGNIMIDEIDNSMPDVEEIIEAKEKELKEKESMLKKLNEQLGEYRQNKDWEKYNETRDEYSKTYSEISSLRMDLSKIKISGGASLKQDIVLDKLKEVREIGGVTSENLKNYISETMMTTKKKQTREIIMKGLNHYPASWLEKSRNMISPLEPKWTTGRAYYMGGIILMDGTLETAVHELGHRMERIPELLKSEKEFFEKRTSGLKSEWLGRGYSRDEKTKKDSFVNPYMGKDYGGDAFELLSMGFEYLYTDYGRLEKDKDMLSWVIGVITAI